MDRSEVIQKVIDAKKAGRYLEIGVYQGTTFQNISCRRKVAVDPEFHISLRSKARFILRNLGSKYREMTSDDFFAKYGDSKPFDVVFIDGLHNYSQSLIDVEKSLKLLSDGGVIIMHDCSPATNAAAVPADSWQDAESKKVPGWTGEWNGDVWKTILKLRSSRNDLDVFVLDCDYGLGVVTKGTPKNMLRFSDAEIEKFTYDDLAGHRSEWLNLKPEGYLGSFLEGLRH